MEVTSSVRLAEEGEEEEKTNKREGENGLKKDKFLIKH